MSDMPRAFTATAEILLPSPAEVMSRLCDRFSEYGAVSGEGRCRRIETGFGTADVEDCGRCLKICAAGHDEVALAYVKLAMAEHLLSLAGDSTSIVWYGDGVAGAPLPYFREMRVTSAVMVTPKMRRLTLTGHNLGRFATGGLHVRLILPKSQDTAPRWPVMGEDGRPAWPAGEDRPDVRVYTLRRVDAAAGEVDIDLVLHEGSAMPGARFAETALPGDVVGMAGPGGGDVPPAADWSLLMGDETALPAIARILEALPAEASVVARISVADAGEMQPLPTKARLDLQWLCRDQSAETLSSTLQNIEWPVDGRSVFAWAGCEFQDFVAIRRHLRTERGLARDNRLVVAYWRKGFAGDEGRKDER